jgi:hypothetical protein
MNGDRDGNRSNPYSPNPQMCCEACIFGSGEHAWFCALHPQSAAIRHLAAEADLASRRVALEIPLA